MKVLFRIVPESREEKPALLNWVRFKHVLARHWLHAYESILKKGSHQQRKLEALFTCCSACAQVDWLQKLFSPSTLDLSISKGGCQRYDSENISRFSASWTVHVEVPHFASTIRSLSCDQ